MLLYLSFLSYEADIYTDVVSASTRLLLVELTNPAVTKSDYRWAVDKLVATFRLMIAEQHRSHLNIEVQQRNCRNCRLSSPLVWAT